MLELQFILTYDGTDYVVDEPDGFKTFNSILKRDFDTHGVFFRFTDSDLKLKFPGSGRDVLKSARDGFGVDATVTLTVKKRTRTTDTFSTIYTGTAVMENIVIDEDYASVDFEEINAMIKIKDRLDVPVKADQTTDLDGGSISAATITEFRMGDKTIQKKSSAILDPRGIDAESGGTNTISCDAGSITENTIIWLEQQNQIHFPTENRGFIATNPEFTSISATVGGRFYLDVMNESYIATLAVSGRISVRNSNNNASGTILVKILTYTYDNQGNVTLNGTKLLKTIDIADYDNGAIGDPINKYATAVDISGSANPDISVTNKFAVLVFEEGTAWSGDFSIWAPVFISTAEGGDFADPELTMTLTINTSEPDTDVEGYFIHEVLRHNVEAITGSDMLYAPFFGRIADGYVSNGCAYNYTETNGWKLRAFTNSVIASLKKRLTSLQAIFGIGYGIERDGVGGSFRFRVDTYDYWYNDALLYEFEDVIDYREEFFDWFSFNEVETGFKDSANDEDEPGTTEDFNSNASWLMPVDRLRGKKSFISEYIGSDLLSEIVRRLQFTKKPTTSSKYDDDLFITEVTSDGAGGWEQGTDKSVSDSGNINPLFNTLINPKFNFFNQYPLINSVVYKKAITNSFKNTFYKNGGDIKIYYSSVSPTTNCLGDLTEGSPSLPGLQQALNDDFTILRYREGRRLFDPIKVFYKVALTSTQVDNIIEAHRNGVSSETIVTATTFAGTINVGQTATDTSSGATGTVTSVNGSTVKILVVSGTFGAGNTVTTSTGAMSVTSTQVNSANNGYFRTTSPDNETVEGWLLSMSFNYADEIASFELIKKSNDYAI